MCSIHQLSHSQSTKGFDKSNLSSQASPEPLFAPRVRNSAMFSEQNVKNLSTISTFLDFRQNNLDYSLPLSLPTVRNPDMPSTRAQINPHTRPAPQTSKLLIQFMLVICSSQQCQGKLNLRCTFSHLNSKKQAQHFLNTDLPRICYKTYVLTAGKSQIKVLYIFAW